MNMFARFDENPAMTLRVIKETKRYRQTDEWMGGLKNAYFNYCVICTNLVLNNNLIDM